MFTFYINKYDSSFNQVWIFKVTYKTYLIEFYVFVAFLFGTNKNQDYFTKYSVYSLILTVLVRKNSQKFR